MTPTITAFQRSPDRGKGLARDMRVRSACCCFCRCFQLSDRSVSGKAVRAHHNVYFQAVDDLSDVLLIVRTGA
jgi:hypothetical protein